MNPTQKRHSTLKQHPLTNAAARSLCHRTAHVRPAGMLSRKRGAILNIGSAAATVLPADPLYSVYAATKGFVDQLSRTMYAEYADKGVHVQLQAPLYVATKMSKIRRASLTVPSPKAVRSRGTAREGGWVWTVGGRDGGVASVGNAGCQRSQGFTPSLACVCRRPQL